MCAYVRPYVQPATDGGNSWRAWLSPICHIWNPLRTLLSPVTSHRHHSAPEPPPSR
jgi:hypothetical protein